MLSAQHYGEIHYIGRVLGDCARHRPGRMIRPAVIRRRADERYLTGRGGGIRTHGLFVPNDSDQRIWLKWVGDGDGWKVAVDLHAATNAPQSLATAIDRENVSICVRTFEPTQGRIDLRASRSLCRADCVGASGAVDERHADETHQSVGAADAGPRAVTGSVTGQQQGGRAATPATTAGSGIGWQVAPAPRGRSRWRFTGRRAS